VALINDICRRIEAKCEFKPVVVSTIVDEMRFGHINFAIAAITLPSRPINEFVFSLPYLQSGGQFLSLKGSKIKYPKDIKGKRVGVRKSTLEGGSIFKELILRIYDYQVKVVEYPTMHDLVMALSKKEVDVIFSNALPIVYWYNQNKRIYNLVGSEIPMGNGYSIMADKKHGLQMMQMNHALLEMMADGTYLKIYSHYFHFLKQ
jgi:ABC-type amino acid transport substrate-binding protein